MKRIKLFRLFPAILLLSIVSVSGCTTSGRGMTFNRDNVFYVAPEGAWIADSLYEVDQGKMMKRTGRMWLPPGTMIGAGE